MHILSLPAELLLTLPSHLHNIEDFSSLASTCRTLRDLSTKTHPNTILRLAAAQSRTFFRPHPYFLIAATAGQLSDWALLSPYNTRDLQSAFRHGIEGLYNLCIEKCGLTMEKIRHMHALRFSAINPISDMIDRCAGHQWYATPNFWEGGVSDAITIDCEPLRALFQIVIYGDLFGSSMNACLNGGRELDVEVRLDYVVYCIPDWSCRPDQHSAVEVWPMGPYAPENVEDIRGDQIALHHLLHCRTWREAWRNVRRQIGDDFEEDWRQAMWVSAVQMQGLEGLEMLRPGGVEKWRGRLEQIRGKIERLEKPPKERDYKLEIRTPHERTLYARDSPNLADEVWVCMATHYPCWRRERDERDDEDPEDEEARRQAQTMEYDEIDMTIDDTAVFQQSE